MPFVAGPPQAAPSRNSLPSAFLSLSQTNTATDSIMGDGKNHLISSPSFKFLSHNNSKCSYFSNAPDVPRLVLGTLTSI
jgi:hypothetical protein